MKIALLGHGRTGSIVATQSAQRGHEIGARVTSRHHELGVGDLAAELRGHDVAIDFSVAAAVPRHVAASMAAGVPLVIGTTGWRDARSRLEQLVRESGGAMLATENFSLGVTLFTRIVARAAEVLARAPYDAFMIEEHHAHKQDAPSGTALRLRDVLARSIVDDIPITSVRAGNIPGTHRIGFDSLVDQIELTHRARSRDGFATGAVLAAEWLIGRPGVWTFDDAIDDITGGES